MVVSHLRQIATSQTRTPNPQETTTFFLAPWKSEALSETHGCVGYSTGGIGRYPAPGCIRLRILVRGFRVCAFQRRSVEKPSVDAPSAAGVIVGMRRLALL